MSDEKEHLQQLSDIRSMMERSSRCISLSGLSGVFSGVFALVGAYFANMKMLDFNDCLRYEGDIYDTMLYLLTDAALVLFASLLAGTLLTIRNSKRKGIAVWDSTARRLLINLAI